MEKPRVLNILKTKGNRLHTFQYALNLTIEEYLGKYLKFSLFKEKYHQVHENYQTELKTIYCELKVHLKSKLKAQAFALYFEHNISSLLQSFEKVIYWIQESNSDENAWKEIDKSLIENPIYSKEDYRDKLKVYLQKLSSENDASESIMFRNHEEILDLKESIVDMNKTVSGFLDELCSRIEEMSFEIKLNDSNSVT